MTISDKWIFLLCPASNDIWFCHLQFTLPAWSQIKKHGFSHFLSLVTHSTSWLILLFLAPIHLLLFSNYHSICSIPELLLLRSPGPPLLFKHLCYLFLLAASLAVVFSHSRDHDLSSCLPLCWIWSGTHSGTSYSSWPNFTADCLPLLSDSQCLWHLSCSVRSLLLLAALLGHMVLFHQPTGIFVAATGLCMFFETMTFIKPLLFFFYLVIIFICF